MKKIVAVAFVHIENKELGFFGFCKQVMGFDTLASISSSYLIQILMTVIEWEITKSTHQPNATAQYAEQLRNYSSQVKDHLDTLERTLNQLPDSRKLQTHLLTCKGSLMAQLNSIQATQGKDAATQYLQRCQDSLVQGRVSLGRDFYLQVAAPLHICNPPPTYFLQLREYDIYSVPTPYVPDSRCPSNTPLQLPSLPDTPRLENHDEDLKTAFDKLNSAKEAQAALDTTLKSEGSQLFSLAQYTLQLSLPKVTGVTLLTRLVLDMVVMPIVIRICYLKGYTPQQTSKLLQWVPVVTGPASQMLAFLLRGPLGLSVDSSLYQKDIKAADQSANDLYVKVGSVRDGVQNAQESTKHNVDVVNTYADHFPSQVVAAVDEWSVKANDTFSGDVKGLFKSEVNADLNRGLFPTHNIFSACGTPIDQSNTLFRSDCMQKIDELDFNIPPFKGLRPANVTPCGDVNAPEDIRIEMPTPPTDPTTSASLGFDIHSTIRSALGLALAELGAMYLLPIIFGPLTFAVLTLFHIETAHSILGAKNGPLTVLRKGCLNAWQTARHFCCPTHTSTVNPAPPTTVHRNQAFVSNPLDQHVIEIEPAESDLIRSEATLSTAPPDYLEAGDLIRGLIKKAAEKTDFIKTVDFKESARGFKDPNGQIEFWILYLDYRHAMNTFSPMCNPLNTFMEFVENVATGIVKLSPKATTYLWLNCGTIIRDLALQTPEGRSKEGFTRLMNHDSIAPKHPHSGYKESGC
jgi:hypothetical protein